MFRWYCRTFLFWGFLAAEILDLHLTCSKKRALYIKAQGYPGLLKA
jgi:hypothetical protein